MSNKALLARLADSPGGGPGKGVSDVVERALLLAEKEYGEMPDGRLEIEHSARIAKTLFGLGFDETTVAAGIVHDLELKAGTENDRIAREVNETVASITADYSKIRQVETSNLANLDSKLLSTVILATAKDLRGIFVKLAARLDTLQNRMDLSKKDLVERADGALKIYAPICQKLGLYELQSLLEDNSLKILQPEVFNRIKELLGKTRVQREKEVENAIAEFSHLFSKEKKRVSVQGRAKSIYGIYKKMELQQKNFEEIFDLAGIRVVCGSVRECYELLGIVHSEFNTVPNQFTDYIANSKKNGYRSIHTVVIWNNRALEVQIRTWDMHYEDETGLASHWEYKQYARDRFFDKRLSWAKQLVEWHRNARDSGNLAHSLKMDFGQNRIFVLTPKNRVIVLPEGSTPIDFAFAIHSDLGYRCLKAKVNGKVAPLSQQLENADTIEILKSKQIQVKRPWLAMAKSAKALAKIKQKLGIKPLKKSRLLPKKGEPLTSDSNMRIAKCCGPVPGDEIVGVRTTKRKISVHRASCPNIGRVSKGKKVSIRWDLAKKDYVVGIKVKAVDRPGLLPSILGIISDNNITITSTDAKTAKNNVLQCRFNVKIRNLDQLDETIAKIRGLPRVFEATRE